MENTLAKGADSVTPFVKGVEILPDGSVARTGTNYSGKFQEAHDASKASIQSRISNLESGGVKGTGEVKHLDDIPRIKEIEVKFNYKTKFDSEEFARQLKDQEKGMNELTVHEYRENRNRFIDKGRAIEGNVAQQTAREEALSDKITEFMDKGKSFDEAEEEAKKWLKTQAALHNPDQVAGGRPEIIGGVGDKRVNFSIGSQWRSRIKIVDKQIEEIAKNMKPEQLKNTYLNVKLTH
ncbi:polymorphic toxin type 15 domain-containing protein [Bacillus wiedmannii]|nr:polymorphic toxin type 15 domain-containing protein [Bacillus wiedmannii]